MKATEAQSLFNKNKKDIEYFYSMIKSQAEYGSNFSNFFETVSDEVALKLINDGYTISKHTDPMGVQITQVRW